MSVSDLLQSLEQQKREPIYPKRIASLQNRGRETHQIQDGIRETVNVLEEGNKSFVIYGEPQSGKTEFMIA
jgi:ribosomal protein L7Ae-like RNA K-turn-binding protein